MNRAKLNKLNLSPEARRGIIQVANMRGMTPDEFVEELEEYVDIIFSNNNSIPDRAKTKDLIIKARQHFKEKPSVSDFLKWAYKMEESSEEMYAGFYEPFAYEDGGRPFEIEKLNFKMLLPETNRPFYEYNEYLGITYATQKMRDGTDWRFCMVSVFAGDEEPSQNEMNGILEYFGFDLNECIRVIRRSDSHYSRVNDIVYYHQEM